MAATSMRPASPVESEASVAIREKLAARGVRVDKRLLGRGSYSTVFLGFSAAFGTVAVKKIDRRYSSPSPPFISCLVQPRERITCGSSCRASSSSSSSSTTRTSSASSSSCALAITCAWWRSSRPAATSYSSSNGGSKSTRRPPGRSFGTSSPDWRRTPAYEITTSRPVCDNAVDCWSAGVVLYVMLTGFMPFDDRRPKELPIVQKNRRLRFHEGVCSAGRARLDPRDAAPESDCSLPPAADPRLPLAPRHAVRDQRASRQEEEEMDDEEASCSTASEIPAHLLDGR
ncbi:Testis-specific serine/threonine-protein kinase 3 [Aphelenchoides fujianensis]|nr:Testis-specific serine/threonine-protein kinase 3 [Aphelenchoides fujianensis]